jgi:hypothetical protein
VERLFEYSPRTHPVTFVPSVPSALFGDSVTVCINQEYIPFITGALEVLTLPNVWPAGSSDQITAIEELIAVLCLPPDDCGVIANLAQNFFGGSGQPACGPQAFASSSYGCTASYDSGNDRFDGCDIGDYLEFFVDVDLSASSGFTVTRVQAVYNLVSTRSDPVGSQIQNCIKLNGSKYANFDVGNTFLGGTTLTLDTGIISVGTPYIRCEGEVRDTSGGTTATLRLVALAITGTGVNPWIC